MKKAVTEIKNTFLFKCLLAPWSYSDANNEYYKSASLVAIILNYIFLISPLLVFLALSKDSFPEIYIFYFGFTIHVLCYLLTRMGYVKIGTTLFALSILFGISAGIMSSRTLASVAGAMPFLSIAILALLILGHQKIMLSSSVFGISLLTVVLNQVHNIEKGERFAIQTGIFAFFLLANLSVFTQKYFNKIVEGKRIKSIFLTRMGSLRDMSASIAHEVNNPLTIIQGYASQLISAIDRNQLSEQKIISTANKIIDTSERISTVIRNLKAFANDGTGDPLRPVPIKSILESVENFCKTRFKNHGIKLTIPNISEQIQVQCRPAQIVQLLLNLLNNSFDAILSLEEKWVEISVKEKSNSVEISIMDSGHGIPENIAEMIFEPFFTTKDIGRGSGLGLPISYSLAKEHNGNLVLDRNTKNTRFILTLEKSKSDSISDLAAA